MSESVQAVPSFIERRPYRRRYAERPTTREWVRHSALFLITILSTTFAGLMLVSQSDSVFQPASPHTFFGYLTYIPLVYASEVIGILQQAFSHPTRLAQGVAFSASLLAILTAHESGHYIACRRYGVDATLPFFIPAPPLIMAGTFGAFIKIKSPIPSRRALFDIGVAGPLAGFVVAVPILFLGLVSSHPAAQGGGAPGEIVVMLNDSLLSQFAARLVGVSLSAVSPNPFYYASWIGLLVTTLNLMPVGQLDGGHAIYAVFGQFIHRWTGRIVFVIMLGLAFAGWFWHGSPSGFVYSLLLAIVLRMPHPEPENDFSPLDRNRRVVALVTLLIFVLCFLPFPITIR
jgi:membrane-associated protease RseP (regulator of RpoE activity)